MQIFSKNPRLLTMKQFWEHLWKNGRDSESNADCIRKVWRICKTAEASLLTSKSNQSLTDCQ